MNDWADVRIGTRTGGNIAKIDFDHASGKLFAVVHWATDNGWALYMSIDKGATWNETYFWFAGTGQQALDVDMTVVGDYVYTGYVASDIANEARLRRNLVSTGGSDNAYGHQLVLDASPNTVTELAVESNADSLQNRIFLAIRQSNNTIRYAWDISTDGTTFSEVSPIVTNAVGGLDMHWNAGFTTWFLFVSLHRHRWWSPRPAEERVELGARGYRRHLHGISQSHGRVRLGRHRDLRIRGDLYRRPGHKVWGQLFTPVMPVRGLLAPWHNRPRAKGLTRWWTSRPEAGRGQPLSSRTRRASPTT